MLDTLLGVSMQTIVAELPLAPEIQHALLGGGTDGRTILDAVRACERGRWLDAFAAARHAGVPDRVLAAAYAESLRWVRELPGELVGK